jgi:hypothetical protein
VWGYIGAWVAGLLVLLVDEFGKEKDGGECKEEKHRVEEDKPADAQPGKVYAG